MFTLYYSLNAMAMGGMNSGATNLIFDYAPIEQRSQALAVYSSIGGLVGFLTTLAVSPLVAKIQAAGNQIFGMTVYAQQLMSGVTTIRTVGGVLNVDSVIRERIAAVCAEVNKHTVIGDIFNRAFQYLTFFKF